MGWCAVAERAVELSEMGQGCGYYMYAELLASPSTSSSTPNQLRIAWAQPEGPGLVPEFRGAGVPG